MNDSNKPKSKCSTKHHLKIVLFTMSFAVSTLNAQVGKILWGDFAKHPARAVIERSPLLKEVDVQMLILHKEAEPFNAPSLSRNRTFSEYFSQYNKASDEFERNRLVNGIKQRFEKRQQDLANIEHFIIIQQSSLGQYSFEQKGLPFNPPDPSLVYLDNATHKGTILGDVYAERDLTIFPPYIHMNEREGEQFVKSNPSRAIEIILAIKPTEIVSRFSQTYLGATAVYAVLRLPQTGKVIAVFPSRETLETEMIRLLGEYQNYLTTCEKNEWYTGSVTTSRDLERQPRNILKSFDKHKSTLQSLGYSPSESIHSKLAVLRSKFDEDSLKFVSILSNKSEFLGKSVGAYSFWGEPPFRIRFLTYDESSGRFSGELEWIDAKSLHKIEGQLTSDLLSPKLIFDETAILRQGKAKPRKGNYLRLLYNHTKLVGMHFRSSAEGNWTLSINLK